MSSVAIPPNLRSLAVLTHLSGLAGYVIPFGGVLAPIILWVVNKDTPVIAAIARQAVLLNVIVYILIVTSFVLWLTIILIPFMAVFAMLLGIAVVALPIVGAVKANGGEYFKYPVIGANP